MSAMIIGGVNSIVVNIATPYEADGRTVRDDLAGIRVWYSTTKDFLPPLQGQLAYDGPGLNVNIPLTDLEAKSTYYVKYAIISDIDPDEVDPSDVYTVKPKNLNDLDLKPPVIPENPNIVVTSGFSFVFISQDQPAYNTGHGHLKTRVYALNKTLKPTVAVKFANAELQTEFTGSIGSFNSDPSTEWAVWVTWVSIDGAQANPIIESTEYPPATKPALTTKTALDVTMLVDAVLKGTGSPFKVVDEGYTENPGTPDAFYVPAGTYALRSFITDGFITNATIKDGAIDSAKINNLDAIHLTAGDGTIGGQLKSANYTEGPTGNGWAIYPSGVAAFASTSIRGKLTAEQIDGTGISIRRKNADGSYTTILDSGRTIQEQINNYAVNASAGITLNFDPTCSNTTAWNSANIATITDGLVGNKVLAGSAGEHLFEGITINKAYTINYDPQKRYQLSALIRRTVAATSGDVHLGLLEVDANNAARYDWGGYLANKIPVNSLTTTFKRYYAYFGPRDLHDGVAKVIVHAILGYPNTGGGRVEIQDIKLEDITLGNAIQIQAVTTAAVDATVKATDTLNTAQSNMGINSWIVNRYAVSVPAGIIPDYTWFANTAPVQTVTVADTISLSGNSIFGGNYDNYIGVATCNVYCETATTWATTVSGDDGHILYVNGNSVLRSGNLRGATAVTINLPKGWSTLEAVWCDQTGSDGFYFGGKVSRVAGVKEMWAFVGGMTPTSGVTASAATTSTWSGTTNIPYDKIFATDATTTLGFNPSFELWTDTYPSSWNPWSGTAPLKETSTTRFGTNAVKYVANGEDGLGMQHSATWAAPMPVGTFISGTIDLNLIGITSGLPGIVIRLFNKPDLSTFVDTLVQPPAVTINSWQRVPFTARAGLTDQIYGVQVYLRGSWSGFASGVFKGTVIFDGLTFAFFDNSIDNKTITVDATTGKLVGAGTSDIVVNNKIIKIDDKGVLTGVGTDSVVVNNGSITVNTAGELKGIGGTEYVVVNNKIIKVNETTGILEGVGTASIVVNNKVISVDANGKLTGIGTGENTVIANSQITVDATSGKLVGAGTSDVVVNNKIIKIDDKGVLTGVGTESVVVNNGSITINTAGELKGIGGTEYVVVNNKIITVDETTGVLTGVGTASIVVNNKVISVDANGKLTGIGTGENTVIANSQITVNGVGQLTGIGTSDVVVDNTKITVDSTTGQLTGAGSSTIVDNSKILIGGTNLMRNSGNFTDTTNWASNGGALSLSTVVKYGSKNTLQVIGGATAGGIVNSVVMRLKPSTQYTVSAIVKGSAAIADGYDNTLHIQNWTHENTIAIHQESSGNRSTGVTTQWKQIYQTFTTPASDDLVYCKFYFYPIINVQLNIAYVQLEQGNKISDWSPCPDDVDALIATSIKGNANDFLSKKVANILPADGEFTIQTPDYGAGNGVLITARGITARKNSINQFAIGNDGDATFSGTVVAAMMKSTDEKFVIDLANKFISISV